MNTGPWGKKASASAGWMWVLISKFILHYKNKLKLADTEAVSLSAVERRQLAAVRFGLKEAIWVSIFPSYAGYTCWEFAGKRGTKWAGRINEVDVEKDHETVWQETHSQGGRIIPDSAASHALQSITGIFSSLLCRWLVNTVSKISRALQDVKDVFVLYISF